MTAPDIHEPAHPFDDDEVTHVWLSGFGARLFNTYSLDRPMAGGPKFLFSDRLVIVRRMIRAMLDAEQERATLNHV